MSSPSPRSWPGTWCRTRCSNGPLIARISPLLPVALLAGLVAVQTVTTDGRLVVDARLAAVGVGVVALLLRAPFLVVLVVAAVTAALLRAAGIG